MRSISIGVTVVAAAILSSSIASANGRYPNADMLVVDPSDPEHLVLRATFGTLVSSDAGRHWSWICEGAVGYSGDPALTVLAGGTLLFAFLGNIRVSSSEGCSFSPVPFDVQGRSAVDVTLDPADPTHGWVLTSGLNGRLQASLLDVTTTSATPLPVWADFVPRTLEVARSRPDRIVVVGFDGSTQSTVLVSDDRGRTWSARPIGLYPDRPMYLSAIDPLDPDTLYIRVEDGTTDRLIVSRDAGASFVEVLSIDAEMLGFALSPDGSRVAVGGPGAGLSVASTADFVFSRAANIQSLRCLTWTEAGLYACAQESLDNWTLALSTDAGQNFMPLWHVQDLVPLACAASTSAGAVCPPAWLDVSAQIGADLVPDGNSDSGSAAPAPAKSKSSCEAVAAPARGRPLSGAGAVLAALLLWHRRRRRDEQEAVRGVPPATSQ